LDTPKLPVIFQSAGQWADEVRRHADLELPRRVRQVLLDTKHYALREVNIRRYFATHPVRKLQIGTGPNRLPGWLNTDVFPHSKSTAYMDATRRFPFEDGAFDRAFSEHQLEHVDFVEGAAMLREIFRVLKPGGRLRVVTPDLERLVRLYTDGQGEVGERYVQWITDRFIPEAPRYSPAFVINCCMRFSGHRFLYDAQTLVALLRDTGFADVTPREPGESDDPELRGIDTHGQFVQDEEMARFEAMTFEARKP
jgi:predicted SAM-dependent methyltransferase